MMNIKRSLTLRFLTLVAILLAGFSVVVYEYYANYRKTGYYERFHDRMENTARLYIDAHFNDSVAILNLNSKPPVRLLSIMELAVIDNNNRLITPDSTKHLLNDELIRKIRSKKYIEFEAGDTQCIGMVISHHNLSFTAFAKVVDVVGKKKLDYLGRVIVFAFLLALIITAAMGWYFASGALKPMQKVVEEAEKITVSNLHKRIPLSDSGDEIDQLSSAFNKMLDRLEASFLMQKNFVSNASHEFRTPITAMKAQIEVMLMQERSKEEYIETLQSIGEDIDRFMQLIFSLSELAKANVDTIGNNRASVPVIEIVAESRADLLRSKSRYRINLQITSLPENDHENYVIGNAALLKSAIENLIENACKFSPDQHCQVVVSFEPGNIIIKVIDEGIGIAANEIAHIFEPFYRANDTRGISGHGIGLSLVKKIIELHNGTIRAESEISKGTQMIVTLPNTENNV
jgi:signal transduction histidine kinase